MKAIVCTAYGPPDVLRLMEVDKPVPRDRDILVNVRATTVTSGDCRVRGFRSPPLLWLPMRLALGVRRPRKPILGVQLAGVVEAVGRRVTKFRVGDPVFAMTGMRFGGYAEYACLAENGPVAVMPAGVTFEEAAALAFGGTTALHFLRKGRIRPGARVLVYGASGEVGVASVQLAKHFGAQVTGVCSGANLELVRSLGADRVVDYTRDDFASGGERYDIVFDAVGKLSKARARRALAPGGAFVSVAGQGIARERAEDLRLLSELASAGELRAVIDRRYPLEDVPEAHRYVDTERKRGAVVIQVGAPSSGEAQQQAVRK